MLARILKKLNHCIKFQHKIPCNKQNKSYSSFSTDVIYSMQSKYHSWKIFRHLKKINENVCFHKSSCYWFISSFSCLILMHFRAYRHTEKGKPETENSSNADTATQELQPLRTGQIIPRFSLGGKDSAAQDPLQQLLFWNWPSKTSGVKYLLLQEC